MTHHCLDELIVIVCKHLCVHLANEFHHHAHHNDESGSGDNQVLTAEAGILREENGDDRDDTEETSAPEVQVIAGLCEQVRCLLSRTHSRNESTALLNALSQICRLECDRHVEVREHQHE